MTYALIVMVLLAVSSIAAGVLIVGHQPLVNLSGVLVSVVYTVICLGIAYVLLVRRDMEGS